MTTGAGALPAGGPGPPPPPGGGGPSPGVPLHHNRARHSLAVRPAVLLAVVAVRARGGEGVRTRPRARTRVTPGTRTRPSSNLTLWFPVVLLHVTLSPWVTATVAGRIDCAACRRSRPDPRRTRKDRGDEPRAHRHGGYEDRVIRHGGARSYALRRFPEGRPCKALAHAPSQHGRARVRVRPRRSGGIPGGHVPARPRSGGVHARGQRLRAAAGPGPVPVPLRVRRRGVARGAAGNGDGAHARGRGAARPLGRDLLPGGPVRRPPGAERERRHHPRPDVLHPQRARGRRLPGQRQDRDLHGQPRGRRDGPPVQRRGLLRRREPTSRRRRPAGSTSPPVRPRRPTP